MKLASVDFSSRTGVEWSDEHIAVQDPGSDERAAAGAAARMVLRCAQSGGRGCCAEGESLLLLPGQGRRADTGTRSPRAAQGLLRSRRFHAPARSRDAESPSDDCDLPRRCRCTFHSCDRRRRSDFSWFDLISAAERPPLRLALLIFVGQPFQADGSG